MVRDPSLSIEDYVLNGVPPPDQAWSADDFGEATAALGAIARVDPAQLPRARSPRSGTLFARMTARQNLEPLEDESRPLDGRAAECTILVREIEQLVRLYTDPPQPGPRFDVERVELAGLTLDAATRCDRLLARFAASLPADDPLHPDRIEGIEKIRKVLRRQVVASIGWLHQRERYRTPARLRLAEHLAASLPDFVAQVPAVYRSEIASQLFPAAREEPDPAVRALLDRTIFEVERTLE